MLSRKVTKQTATVFSVALFLVAVIGIEEVYRLASSNATRSLDNSRLTIEKALADVEYAATIMNVAVMNKDNSLSNLTTTLLELDTNIISCAVAYEPYFYNPAEEYHMTISYKDTTGQILSQSMGGEDFDYFYQDWYQIPMLTGNPHWNEPSFDIAGGSLATSYSVPIYDAVGSKLGVLRLAVSLDWLSAVVNSFSPYKSSVTMVVSRNGSIMTRRFKKSDLSETIFTNGIANSDDAVIKSCKKIISGSAGSMIFGVDGQTSHLQYQPLYNGWTLVELCSYFDFLGPINRVLAVLLLCGMIGILVQYYSLRKKIGRLTKPIVVMTYSAQNMARGNFNASIPSVKRNNEIKMLETSMHLLQTSFKKYIEEIKFSTSNRERIESELNVANNIQMSFLPREFPQNDKFECYASLTPAKSVGGDLYDFKQIGNTLFFSVGDVSGKGVPAALFMAIAKSAFNFVKTKNPDEIASRINNAFAENNDGGMFVTLFVAKVNLDTLEMEFCNGGHNPIIVVDPDGSARYIHAKPNIALGLFPDFKFEAEKLQLKKGSRIIAYTDGISEAENKAKELFGDDRLIDFAGALKTEMTSKDVTETLLDKVHEFTAGNEQNDDMTIFTVKF